MNCPTSGQFALKPTTQANRSNFAMDLIGIPYIWLCALEYTKEFWLIIKVYFFVRCSGAFLSVDGMSSFRKNPPLCLN